MSINQALIEPKAEVVIDVFRTHWRRLVWPILLASIALAGFLVVASEADGIQVGLAGAVLAAALFVAGTGIAGWWIERTVVTSERVFQRGGLISVNVEEIPLIAIDRVRLSMTAMDRALNSGAVTINAGVHGVLVLPMMGRPVALQRAIQHGKQSSPEFPQQRPPSSGRTRTVTAPAKPQLDLRPPSAQDGARDTSLEKLTQLHVDGVLTDTELMHLVDKLRPTDHGTAQP